MRGSQAERSLQEAGRKQNDRKPEVDRRSDKEGTREVVESLDRSESRQNEREDGPEHAVRAPRSVSGRVRLGRLNPTYTAPSSGPEVGTAGTGGSWKLAIVPARREVASESLRGQAR